MVRTLVIVILFVFSVPGMSQHKKYVTVDLGLLQVHQDFFKLYDGILDVGASYNRSIHGNLYGGLDFHMGFLHRQNTSARTTILKPAILVNYMFHVSQHIVIIPQAKIGYGFLRLSNGEYNYKETQSGWNPGGELRVQWKRERQIDFYVFGRLDYIKLNKDESFTMLDHYRHVYLTSFGLGIFIKSAKS